MIIPTVLGCVAAIFAWILQYQNGGLLNVIMTPIRSSDSPNVAFDVVSDFSGISTQVMNIVWGRLTKADLAVLEALPADLGGGEKGVAEAIAHPNNDGKLIVAFIACLAFASVGLVVIFLFSFIYCLCCCYSGCHQSEDKVDKDKLESNVSTKDQNCLCCGLYILTFVMTALLLVGLTVCIGYYFGAANVLSETLADSKAKDMEVVSWLEGNSSSFSVSHILQFFVSNALTFGKSISSAKTKINVTVSTVQTTLLESTLPKEISTLVQALVSQFKVAEIKNAVNGMVHAIGNVNNNSEYISTNHASTVAMVSANSFELNEILNDIGESCSFKASEIRLCTVNDRGKSASQGRGACKSTSRFCWGGMFFVCSGLLLVPIIVLGLVAVVTVAVGVFMHAEVCPYIANSRGMRMTDYVANSKVQDVWDNVVLPQLSGGGKNDYANIVNLKAPQNPLQAILIGCDPQNGEPTSKSGLLAQMGIGNLFNTTAFLQKSRLLEGIDQAMKNLVKNIANANLSNKLPDDRITKLKKFTQTFQQILKLLDLPKSIKHLQINVFKTAAIESFAKNLPSNCNAQKDELIGLVRYLNESNTAMNELRSAYEGLNGNATALNFSKLEEDITSLKTATANFNAIHNTLAGPLDAFEKALIGSVSKIGMEAFASMLQSLLPCDSLHYAIKSVVFMSCGASGLAPRVFAWGLFLFLCLFFTFFSLLSLCLLWRVQNHQAKRFVH